MSRTDLDPATLARSVRRMAGDGSIEWVCEPTQASMLLDIADALDEVEELRELLAIASDMARDYDGDRRLLRRLVQELYEDQCDECDQWKYRDRMRELGVEVPDGD